MLEESLLMVVPFCTVQVGTRARRPRQWPWVTFRGSTELAFESYLSSFKSPFLASVLP